MKPLLQRTERGLYCEAGDFHIDPWREVERALITHAHADHARGGSASYLTCAPGVELLRQRIGNPARIEGLPFGERRSINGVHVSFHPAGHILGSAQVRVEHRGEVWVFSGDYKTEPDPTCQSFEPVRCHTFITESTFGLPIYRWRPAAEIFSQINAWWRDNQQAGRTSVLFAYSLGKAQRLLAGIDSSLGPIFLHGGPEKFLSAYRDAGVRLPDVQHAEASAVKAAEPRGLVIAPPSADGSPWLRKFGLVSRAFASGWMQLRGSRRRRNLDRGFVLSDHADWEGLLASIDATGAEQVLVSHGYSHILARWLGERGKRAAVLETPFDSQAEENT